jgi:hypothetical protein
MGRQAARLAPAICVPAGHRHNVTVTNPMCTAGSGRLGGRTDSALSQVVEAVVRHCHIVVDAASGTVNLSWIRRPIAVAARPAGAWRHA